MRRPLDSGALSDKDRDLLLDLALSRARGADDRRHVADSPERLGEIARQGWLAF